VFETVSDGVALRDHGVLLAHRGKVGGGRTGIGKQAFLEFWKGETIEIGDGGREAAVIPVGFLGDPALIDQIAAFVGAVRDFKKQAVEAL